jgi:hypothetical protein
LFLCHGRPVPAAVGQRIVRKPRVIDPRSIGGRPGRGLAAGQCTITDRTLLDDSERAMLIRTGWSAWNPWRDRLAGGAGRWTVPGLSIGSGSTSASEAEASVSYIAHTITRSGAPWHSSTWCGPHPTRCAGSATNFV